MLGTAVVPSAVTESSGADSCVASTGACIGAGADGSGALACWVVAVAPGFAVAGVASDPAVFAGVTSVAAVADCEGGAVLLPHASSAPIENAVAATARVREPVVLRVAPFIGRD